MVLEDMTAWIQLQCHYVVLTRLCDFRDSQDQKNYQEIHRKEADSKIEDNSDYKVGIGN